MSTPEIDDLVIETKSGLDFAKLAESTSSLQLSHFNDIQCYKAMDGQNPEIRLTYSVVNMSLLVKSDSELMARREGAVALQAEQALLNALTSSKRNVFRHVSTRGEAITLAPVNMCVSTRVAQADVTAFNEWYEGEHVGMMAKIPGWIRTRRYQRLRGHGEDYPADQVEFLAVYEFEEQNGLQGPIHKTASATPGTATVREMLRWKENRMWKHHLVVPVQTSGTT